MSSRTGFTRRFPLPAGQATLAMTATDFPTGRLPGRRTLKRCWSGKWSRYDVGHQNGETTIGRSGTFEHCGGTSMGSDAFVRSVSISRRYVLAIATMPNRIRDE